MKAHARTPRPSIRAAALVAALALAAVPAVGVERNFDLRTTLVSGQAPAAVGAHARAIESWRAELPGLRATLDPTTGATRTLSNPVGMLTGPRAAADVESIAVGFAYEALDLLGLEATDLAGYEVTDSVDSRTSGVTHLYLRQRYAGIPVYNGQLHVNVTADGRILSVNNLFVPRIAGAANTTRPEIDAAAALDALAGAVDGIALGEPSEARLMWLPTRPGEARLVWNFQVETRDRQHWWDVTVDAVDGRVWTRFDWIADAQYRVYALPIEAPTFTTPLPPADARTTEVDPQNATASPFGWHDLNGAPGAETTLTSGNNVNACIDRSPEDDVCDAGSQPDGGAGLNFTPALDLTMDPLTYQPAAVVNLYYWNNIIHDVAYLYGFDEQGGNFQENNYGNGGLGSDSVNADGQDGSGFNNANFGTPPDGSNPRMQMFIWTAPNPDRDGDLDSGIITHEYGHGISNRLVGGPSNVSCLGTYQRPGEGLSDWWSLFYTFGPTNETVRGIGTYALNQPTTGTGIRTQRYDKNPEPNSNTWTYESLHGLTQSHAIGEKWGQAYWYVQGRLEDEHGFDLDPYAFTGTGSDAGNIRAMFYIIEGLKNSVCGPSFTDVRDGILAAAASSYGGIDVCRIWQGFADYGMGVNANDGNGTNNNVVNDFTVPASCAFVAPPVDAQICAGDDFVDTVGVGGGFGGPVTMSTSGVPSPATSSFSPNPVPLPLPSMTTLTITNTAGVTPGIYSIDVIGNDGGGPQSSSFDLEVLGGPAAPGLTSPANGATNVSLTPSLVWTAVAGANSYFVEVDDDPGFGSPEFTDTVTNTVTVANGLEAITTYNWRVTATDDCGPGAPSPVFTFTTRDTMPFIDGFESGDTSAWSSTIP